MLILAQQPINKELTSNKWRRLTSFKVNCDTAAKNNKVAVACVIRDGSGLVLNGFKKRTASGSLVFLVEASAVGKHVSFALKLASRRLLLNAYLFRCLLVH